MQELDDQKAAKVAAAEAELATMRAIQDEERAIAAEGERASLMLYRHPSL